jgi:hypothetical protein
MVSSKFKLVIIIAAGVAGLVAIVYQQVTLRRLHTENLSLAGQLASLRENAPPPQPTPDPAELERARAEHEELLRLRGQVNQLRRERDELQRKLNSLSVARTNAAVMPAQAPDAAWVQQMLNAPAAQQGAAAGALRGKFLRGESISGSEIALRDALAQRNLNSLERTPSEFADFQAAYIQGVLGLTDPEKGRQIHDLILKTYEQAATRGLDIPSKPVAETDQWVTQRHQLDRRATSAVQGLLTPEERSVFNRAFLGVMGVDLGTGVDKSNYPPGFLGP